MVEIIDIDIVRRRRDVEEELHLDIARTREFLAAFESARDFTIVAGDTTDEWVNVDCLEPLGNAIREDIIPKIKAHLIKLEAELKVGAANG
jgi:hypothetical protein